MIVTSSTSGKSEMAGEIDPEDKEHAPAASDDLVRMTATAAMTRASPVIPLQATTTLSTYHLRSRKLPKTVIMCSKTQQFL